MESFFREFTTPYLCVKGGANPTQGQGAALGYVPNKCLTSTSPIGLSRYQWEHISMVWSVFSRTFSLLSREAPQGYYH